jgi:hypothetical protein
MRLKGESADYAETRQGGMAVMSVTRDFNAGNLFFGASAKFLAA